MKTLFGIPMLGLSAGLAAAVILIVIVLAFLAVRNRLVFKMAVRNIPRRPAQTILIVAGLTLSTTIIAAALAIGDTVTGSIRGAVFDNLGSTDVRITSSTIRSVDGGYVPYSRVEDIRRAVEGDGRVDGVHPQIRQVVPVTLPRTEKTDARVVAIGFDPGSLAGFDQAWNVAGDPVDLVALRPSETVISDDLARKLDAREGDTIQIVTPQAKTDFTVKAIARRGGLSGAESNFPNLLVRLDSLQRVLGRDGQVNIVDVSTRGGEAENLRLSSEVADDLRLKFTDREAASRIFTALGTPEILASIDRQAAPESSLPAGLKSDLSVLATELQRPEPSQEFIGQIAKTSVSGAVLVAVEQAGRSDVAVSLFPAFAQLQVLEVDGIKSRLVDLAELIGNFVATFFTVFGSFSIIVGLLLIFLVFVLLAASRMSEMGIARAVGMRRSHLVQMFLFEGFVYAALAAIVGTVVGLLASLVIVRLLIQAIPADEAFTIQFHLKPTSVVAAFCAGLLVTALTVSFSAYRVSRLNIVVAIRGVAQEELVRRQSPVLALFADLGRALTSPIFYLVLSVQALVKRTSVRPGLVRLGLSLLVVPWIFWIVRAAVRLASRFVGQGWPLVIFGVFIAQSGISANQAAPFTIGASILLVGVALFVRWILRRTILREEVQDRIAYTILGLLLLVFWSLPFSALEGITGRLNSNIEMFILSGVWMVAAATWIVAYNADALLWLLDRTLGRLGRMKPVLKMSVAYPLAARFRTGLTLAMFALVIFTLIVFAILNNLGNIARDEPDRVTGGYEIRARVSPVFAVDDMTAAIGQSPVLEASDFAVIGAQTTFNATARQVEAQEQRFRGVSVRVSSKEFLDSNKLQITSFDPEYGAEADEIWAALANDSSLALVSQALVSQQQGGFADASAFRVEGVDPSGRGPVLEAFEIELRPPLDRQTGGSGEALRRKVIGVVDAFAESIESQQEGGIGGGSPLVYVGPGTRSAFSAAPRPWTVYKFRLPEPGRAEEIARRLETAFLEHGMVATSTKKDIEDSLQQNQAFNRLFQGFMGLGLIVGVASLGVISFRAVVERRQSIGMLRAMGFRAGMIRLQFLIEALFVAFLGTAMGIGLGTVISWNIVNSIGDEVEGLKFAVPWAEVAIITGIALFFSLLMTLAPATQAARIYPSEALRNE